MSTRISIGSGFIGLMLFLFWLLLTFSQVNTGLLLLVACIFLLISVMFGAGVRHG